MQTAVLNLLNALHTRWEHLFGRLTYFICLSENQLLWPWRKNHWSLYKASPCLCCMVPVRWWEALDLSQIAQPPPPSGLPVHCCELRRGRLWIAKVVPAFYRNDRGSVISFLNTAWNLFVVIVVQTIGSSANRMRERLTHNKNVLHSWVLIHLLAESSSVLAQL